MQGIEKFLDRSLLDPSPKTYLSVEGVGDPSAFGVFVD